VAKCLTVSGVFAAFLMPSLSARAGEIQWIRINNIKVAVSKVERRAGPGGEMLPHSAVLVSPTDLPFGTNQIRIPADREIVLYDNGQAWMVASDPSMSHLDWTLPNGRLIVMDCSQANSWISFDPNGNYRSGCEMASIMSFQFKDFSLTVDAGSKFDLNGNGDLIYSEKVISGRGQMFGQEFRLEPSSEIAFNEDGFPQFFKLAAGESLTVPTERLGELVIQQSDKFMYTEFNEKDEFESGLIGKPLRIGDVTVPAGSFLSFASLADAQSDSSSRELTVVFPQVQSVCVGELSVDVVQIHMDSSNRIIGVVTGRAFEFHSPEGDTIAVPVNSKIYFSDHGKVIRIDIASLAG
jgi:hypothetical protein